LLEKIGEGSYGQVYKAKDNKTQEIVAIKKIIMNNDEDGIPGTALREICILKELKHKNIIALKNVEYKPYDRMLYLVLEFMDCDLREYYTKLCKSKYIPCYELKSIMFQILKGVSFCHLRRIIHRDLKPMNILYKNGVIKIADFGLARPYLMPTGTLTREIESLWYRAPEVMLGEQKYSLPVDIWTIGCIFAELVEKKVLF